MLPDSAVNLPLHLRGFLFLLIKRARQFRLGYTIDTNAELGKLAVTPEKEEGLHRSTVDDYLKTLKKAQFIEITKVDGRRRIYPVDKEGNPTMPAKFSPEARTPQTAPAPSQEGAQVAPPNTGDPARVVFVQRERKKPSTPKPPERQRLQAITESPQEPQAAPEHPQACATRPASTPLEPARDLETAQTKEEWFAAWKRESEALASSAARPLTDHDRVRGALTPATRDAFDRLPAARQATLAREYGSNLTASGIAMLERTFATGAGAAAAVQTAELGTADLIRALPRSDGSAPKTAASRVTSELGKAGGQRYWSGWEMLMTAIWRGTVDAEPIAACFERTDAKRRKSHVPKPDAYFWRCVTKETGIRGEDLQRLAFGGT
jgi:hypothetical protein